MVNADDYQVITITVQLLLNHPSLISGTTQGECLTLSLIGVPIEKKHVKGGRHNV